MLCGMMRRRCSAPDADTFGLQDLTDIKKRFEVLRLGIVAQHVLANQLIAARMPLMGHHHRRLDFVISRVWCRY